jgi:hypothetical protein
MTMVSESVLQAQEWVESAIMEGHRMTMPTDELIERLPLRLELPPGNFKAYLFDCDGTIADSMPLHYVAWNEVLSTHGCEFPEDLFYAWGGCRFGRSSRR